MQPGDFAPDFSTTTDQNEKISLSKLRGQWVTLFFYPKDNTPGCSIQARRFEDFLEDFTSLGAKVIGISVDSDESHRNFREKKKLSYGLIADTDRVISEKYGVLRGINKITGKASRQTFLIDPEGKIVRIWKSANPLTNAGDVLKEIKKALSNR